MLSNVVKCSLQSADCEGNESRLMTKAIKALQTELFEILLSYFKKSIVDYMSLKKNSAKKKLQTLF